MARSTTYVHLRRLRGQRRTNLNVVGRLLGHSKITTPQRYAHLADDPIRRATESIGEALAGSMARQP